MIVRIGRLTEHPYNRIISDYSQETIATCTVVNQRYDAMHNQQALCNPAIDVSDHRRCSWGRPTTTAMAISVRAVSGKICQLRRIDWPPLRRRYLWLAANPPRRRLHARPLLLFSLRMTYSRRLTSHNPPPNQRVSVSVSSPSGRIRDAQGQNGEAKTMLGSRTSFKVQR